MEIIQKFSLLLVVISLLYYGVNKFHKITSTFLMVPICTFFLCLIFIEIEVNIGIGFGLFAIFSFLRFRTESISIKSIIFLFVTLSIAIFNALLPMSNFEFLIISNIGIVVCYFLLIWIENSSFINKEQICDYTFQSDNFIELSEKDKINFINNQLNIKCSKYIYKEINQTENSIYLKIYY